jgi:TM2 domain-containing membrane protein YozV
MSTGPSDKSRGVALALAMFLGYFGAHRFYAGKTGTGVLMAVTIGGLGLWWIYDVILVAGGGFRDAQGRLVSHWDPIEAEHAAAGVLPEAVLAELEALRAQVEELVDRVDFTERLLARPAEERPSSQFTR